MSDVDNSQALCQIKRLIWIIITGHFPFLLMMYKQDSASKIVAAINTIIWLCAGKRIFKDKDNWNLWWFRVHVSGGFKCINLLKDRWLWFFFIFISSCINVISSCQMFVKWTDSIYCGCCSLRQCRLWSWGRLESNPSSSPSVHCCCWTHQPTNLGHRAEPHTNQTKGLKQ